MASPRDIQNVDDFFSLQKRLENGVPEWKRGTREYEYEAKWIIESLDGGTVAHLRFRTCRFQRAYPSISVIYRNNPIWRLDIQPDDKCHPNPLWGQSLGLEPMVCGTHCHMWCDNRNYLMDSTVWDLPARRKLPAQMRRLPQVLPFMAEELRIELTPDQRKFDIPPKRDLFDLEEL